MRQWKQHYKMWIGNYDGDRQGLVISTSKVAARKVLRTGMREFNEYWVEQPSYEPTLEIDTLYTRPMTRGGEFVKWTKGRCP